MQEGTAVSLRRPAIVYFYTLNVITTNSGVILPTNSYQMIVDYEDSNIMNIFADHLNVGCEG